jgi:hypothetical protein
MATRPPDIAPFVATLAETRSPSTVRLYRGVVNAYLTAHPRDADNPARMVEWLRSLVAGKSWGSVAPRVSALRAWCLFRNLDPAPLASAAAIGGDLAPAAPRETLDEAELTAFHRAVRDVFPASVRCVLHLLPLTGARVDDLCALQWTQYVRRQGVTGFAFPTGFVPAVESAQAHMAEHRAFADPGRWVFPALANSEDSMQVDSVRTALRQCRGGAAWTLDGLSRSYRPVETFVRTE